MNDLATDIKKWYETLPEIIQQLKQTGETSLVKELEDALSNRDSSSELYSQSWRAIKKMVESPSIQRLPVYERVLDSFQYLNSARRKMNNPNDR